MIILNQDSADGRKVKVVRYSHVRACQLLSSTTKHLVEFICLVAIELVKEGKYSGISAHFMYLLHSINELSS